MITTLRCRALDWYMKFSIVPVGDVSKTLNKIRMGMIDELRKPNSESKCIIEIKEIKQLLTKFVWGLD